MRQIYSHKPGLLKPLPSKLNPNRKNGEILLLHGKKGFGASHFLVTELVQKNASVHLIDCAIRFDIFQITSTLKNESLLDNLLIQRAFTPYQILDSTKQISLSKVNREAFYFYLAPFKQFFDGDVKPDEAEFLLKKLIREFASLKNSGVHLVIAEKEKYSSKIFPEAMNSLRSIASQEMNLVSLPEKLSDTDLFGEFF